MWRKIQEVHPALAEAGKFIDWKSNQLGRLQSEMRTEFKKSRSRRKNKLNREGISSARAHLADRGKNGIFNTMKTTIDNAGRLVIPKDIRRESGIKPGMPLEVRWEKGAIAITPAPLPVKLERKGRLLVAVPTEGTPRLSADTVERTRKALRKERSGEPT
jgi:AbrB family looped-hinge helix DNA binding protein